MAEKTDIAFVISDLGAGGAQRALVRAAEGLVARGRRVVVITLAGRAADFHRLPDGVERMALDAVKESRNPVVGLVRNLLRIVALRRALRASGAKAALSFVTQTNILAIVAGWRLGVRIVVSERNDPRKQSVTGVWRRLRDFLYPLAHAVTANSQGAVDALAGEIPGISPVLLPNPPPKPAPAARRSGRPAFILNVGRLHRQKGQDVLFEAFASFLRRHPDVRLVVAGEGGERRSLEDLASRLGISGNIDMSGAIADVDGLYGMGPVFVLSSRHEGTPNALLEAMAHGLVCIATDCSPGVGEALRDGVDGILVPPDDAAALAAALERIFDDPELRWRLAAAAHAAAVARAQSYDLDVWERVLGTV